MKRCSPFSNLIATLLLRTVLCVCDIAHHLIDLQSQQDILQVKGHARRYGKFTEILASIFACPHTCLHSPRTVSDSVYKTDSNHHRTCEPEHLLANNFLRIRTRRNDTCNTLTHTNLRSRSIVRVDTSSFSPLHSQLQLVLTRVQLTAETDNHGLEPPPPPASYDKPRGHRHCR